MTTEVVQIYLPILSTIEWIHALSILRADIERLTLRPLKWLRFAIFTVCGAKGHLSITQGGDIVDYDNVSLADRYYYTPDDGYHLVDVNAFNVKSTSSGYTPQCVNFRRDIYARDSGCVITGGSGFDATYIIPRRKGNKYITFIVHDRSSLYEQLPFSLEDDVDINCVENGMLLREDLHGKFYRAEIGFLKTPNFAMVPADVLPLMQGHIPHSRTTLQYIIVIGERYPVPPSDVQVDWSQDDVCPPPSILLDFVYGSAVAKRWMCDRLRDMLVERFNNDFSKVLPADLGCSTPEDDESIAEPNTDDTGREPSRGKQKKRKNRRSSNASTGLLESMDHVLFLSMLLKGTTPQSMVAEWERQKKEKELRSQEHSCKKVQQWLDLNAPHDDITPSAAASQSKVQNREYNVNKV